MNIAGCSLLPLLLGVSTPPPFSPRACVLQEEKVLEYWDKIDAFKTQLKLTEGQPECVLCFDTPSW